VVSIGDVQVSSTAEHLVLVLSDVIYTYVVIINFKGSKS
jgi:hypothetical protein